VTANQSALIDGGSYLAEGVTVGGRARISGSVIYRNAVVSADAVVIDSIVGAGSIIGEGSVLREAVVADAVHIGAGNELLSECRIFPGVTIPEGAIRFSSDR
jgi:mannose-1-phosphate guanylyltransferase